MSYKRAARNKDEKSVRRFDVIPEMRTKRELINIYWTVVLGFVVGLLEMVGIGVAFVLECGILYHRR